MTEIVLLANPGSVHHARPFEAYFGERVVVEPDWRPTAIARHDPELVVTFDEHDAVLGLCVGEMARRGVATLQVMDGILEWRRTWAYPTTPQKRPLNQPALAHKIACLGRADARVMESWGNVGKCEVVGSPRFDGLVRRGAEDREARDPGRPFRLLLMTAKTPGFDAAQVEVTLQSLRDVREELEGRSDVEVVWRVTKELDERLGVPKSVRDVTGGELHQVLRTVDAVLTTPSTAMLEGMLVGLPVALLDYHNCPHYVPAAWRVTCRSQIAPAIEEMKNPSLARTIYQEYCLEDALACRTAAMPRMARLIERMISIRRQLPSGRGNGLRYPHRLLDEPDDHVAWPSDWFDLQALYPTHAVFGRADLTAMQAELEAALGTVERLSHQVDILTRRLHRIPGYRLAGRLVKRLAR